MTKAQQISVCVETIAKYFAVDPHRVITAYAPKNRDVARARILVWHHLHKCGMSFYSIGRIHRTSKSDQGLSADNVSRRVKYGMLTVTSEESLLLATLPRIETTLKISKA
jgi:hypothetical protein